MTRSRLHLGLRLLFTGGYILCTNQPLLIAWTSVNSMEYISATHIISPPFAQSTLKCICIKDRSVWQMTRLDHMHTTVPVPSTSLIHTMHVSRTEGLICVPENHCKILSLALCVLLFDFNFELERVVVTFSFYIFIPFFFLPIWLPIVPSLVQLPILLFTIHRIRPRTPAVRPSPSHIVSIPCLWLQGKRSAVCMRRSYLRERWANYASPT